MRRGRFTRSTAPETVERENTFPSCLNLDKDSYPEQFAKIRFTPILYIVDAKDESIKHKFVGYSARGEFLQVLKGK